MTRCVDVLLCTYEIREKSGTIARAFFVSQKIDEPQSRGFASHRSQMWYRRQQGHVCASYLRIADFGEKRYGRKPHNEDDRLCNKEAYSID